MHTLGGGVTRARRKETWRREVGGRRREVGGRRREVGVWKEVGCQKRDVGIWQREIGN